MLAYKKDKPQSGDGAAIRAAIWRRNLRLPALAYACRRPQPFLRKATPNMVALWRKEATWKINEPCKPSDESTPVVVGQRLRHFIHILQVDAGHRRLNPQSLETIAQRATHSNQGRRGSQGQRSPAGDGLASQRLP